MQERDESQAIRAELNKVREELTRTVSQANRQINNLEERLIRFEYSQEKREAAKAESLRSEKEAPDYITMLRPEEEGSAAFPPPLSRELKRVITEPEEKPSTQYRKEKEAQAEQFSEAEIHQEKKAAHQAASQGPTLTKKISVFLKRLGPKEEMSWETAVGTYWLPRVGIVALSIGVVLLMALAIQHFRESVWIKHARVALGYGVAVALLIVGKRLEAKMENYARVLMSGGLGLVYFVTYATHYIPMTKIFDTPTLTLIGLSIIVVVYWFLAQLRRSRLLATGVLVLGHLAVLISTMTLPEPSRFAIAGLILLNIASALFLVKNKWYYVAAAGLVASWLNIVVWLMKSPSRGLVFDFWAVLSILSMYWVMFAAADFFSPDDLRRKSVSTRFRSLYSSFNSACFFWVSVALMRSFDFAQGRTWLYYWIFGAVLILTGVAYRRKNSQDPIHNLYIVKGTSIITLGLAVYFEGPMLTVSLAVEAVVLLLSARRSGHVVTRIASHGVALLAVAHGVFTLIETRSLMYGDVGYLPTMIPGSLAALALLFLSQLYQRTDWSGRTPIAPNIVKPFQDMLYQLDLVAAPCTNNITKPFGGLLFPYMQAFGAMSIVLCYGHRLIDFSDAGPVLALLGLAIAGVGILLKAKPFTVASLALSISGCVYYVGYLAGTGEIPYDHAMYSGHFIRALLIIVPFLVLSELSRLATAGENKLWLHFPAGKKNERGGLLFLPYGYAIIGGGLLSLTTLNLAAESDMPLVFSLTVLVFAVYAWLRDADAFGLTALLVTALAGVSGMIGFHDESGHLIIYASLAGLFGSALLSERQYVGGRIGVRFHQARLVSYYVYGVPFVLLGWTLLNKLSVNPGIVALAVCGIVVVALTNILRARTMTVYGAFYLVGAFFAWLMEVDGTHERVWHILTFSLVAAQFAGDRYFAFRDDFSIRMPGMVLVVTGWLTLLIYTFHQARPDWFCFWWVMVAFAMMGYALYFRSRTAVALSCLSALGALMNLLVKSYPMDMAVTSLVMGYGALILLLIILERGYRLAGERFTLLFDTTAQKKIDVVLVAVPSALLIMMLERIPGLSDFYLSISWTIAAVGLFAVAFITTQKYYRYAGLMTFVLALFRVALVDTRELTGVYRILAWMVLGVVLLAVAYGYVWASNRMKQERQEAGEAAEEVKNGPKTSHL